MAQWLYRAFPEQRLPGEEGTTFHSGTHGIVPGAYYQAGQLVGPVPAITEEEWLVETARHLEWGRVELKPTKFSSWCNNVNKALEQKWYKNRKVIIATVNSRDLVVEGVQFRVASEIYRDRLHFRHLDRTEWPSPQFWLDWEVLVHGPVPASCLRYHYPTSQTLSVPQIRGLRWTSAPTNPAVPISGAPLKVKLVVPAPRILRSRPVPARRAPIPANASHDQEQDMPLNQVMEVVLPVRITVVPKVEEEQAESLISPIVQEHQLGASFLSRGETEEILTESISLAFANISLKNEVSVSEASLPFPIENSRVPVNTSQLQGKSHSMTLQIAETSAQQE